MNPRPPCRTRFPRRTANRPSAPGSSYTAGVSDIRAGLARPCTCSHPCRPGRISERPANASGHGCIGRASRCGNVPEADSSPVCCAAPRAATASPCASERHETEQLASTARQVTSGVVEGHRAGRALGTQRTMIRPASGMSRRAVAATTTAPATVATARPEPTTHRPRTHTLANCRVVTPVTPHQHASTLSGSGGSPLLTNLFLHQAFDEWPDDSRWCRSSGTSTTRWCGQRESGQNAGHSNRRADGTGRTATAPGRLGSSTARPESDKTPSSTRRSGARPTFRTRKYAGGRGPSSRASNRESP